VRPSRRHTHRDSNKGCNRRSNMARNTGMDSIELSPVC
jgi:hypothetical protein